MRNKFIELVEEPFLKEDIPNIRIGDQISVSIKVIEGNKTRIQKFDGLVIAKGGTGSYATVTVRKIASGVGVERVFLLHSPFIENIKVLATGAKIRRAKLYYMRSRRGKKARIKYSQVFK